MSGIKICFVTTNKSKLSEAVEFCAAKSLNIEITHENAELFEVQTRDPRDLRAVALHKGKQAWDRVGNPVLVEFTGLFLAKYGSFPGSLSKHVFKGIGYKGLFRLVDSGDAVSLISTLVYVDEYGNANVFEGRQEGILMRPEAIDELSDFPFDRIFIPDGFSKTYQELALEKPAGFEAASYRLSALHQFINHCKKAHSFGG